MRAIYHRPTRREDIVQAARVLSQFSGRALLPVYDIIVDNPWETEDDVLETLRLLLEIEGPYEIIMFSLTFFPGTELYERARQEGLLRDEVDEVYRQHYLANRRSYANGLLKLVQIRRAPRGLIRFLLRDGLRRRNWVWLPYLAYAFFAGLGFIAAGWRALRRGDWAAFVRAFRAPLAGPARDLPRYQGAFGEVARVTNGRKSRNGRTA